MITIMIRALILYTLVLIGMRLMGKGELAEMQPFELVITLMISELAALPMGNTGIPLINGIISILTLIFIQVIISYTNLKSEKVRRFICGRPSILIDRGMLNEHELKRLRININDLVGQLRAKDYPNIADIEFAILETNGDMSIIPKTGKRTVIAEDLNIVPPYEGLPLSLILDGQINYDNLKKLNLDKAWLKDQLKMKDVHHHKEILFCYMDANKKLYLQKKDKYRM